MINLSFDWAVNPSLFALRIYYGSKVHYLCTRAGVGDVRRIMEEMSVVVTSMIDRVMVDLGGDGIAQCLQIFDVRSWGSSEQEGAFDGFIRTLLKSLNLEARAKAEFAHVARTLVKVVHAAEANKLNVPNRLAWSWVLFPHWRARYLPQHQRLKHLPVVEKLIAFYLSLKVNTTTLERNLGSLCEQLRNHSGPVSAEGTMIAAVVSIALDGPKREEELFQPGGGTLSGFQLLPTEFGKACAKLWLATYGRRFQYKYAKAAPAAPATSSAAPAKQARKRCGGPRPGTFEAVKRMRQVASKALCQAAASASKSGSCKVSSFVDGIDLPLSSAQAALSAAAMEGTRWGRAAGPAALLGKRKKTPAQLFQDHTRRKQARLSGFAWHCLMILFFMCH